MKVNNTTVIRRHQRPSANSKLLLDFYLIQDGAYADPYQVCSVHIFPNTTNGDADSYLDLTAGSENYGLVSSTSGAYYEFRNFNDSGEWITDTGSDYFKENKFGGDSGNSSGIHKLGTGHFGSVLVPDSEWRDITAGNGVGDPSGNAVSATAKYMDVWTVVNVAGSKAKTYINTFELYNDGAFAITEPITCTANFKLGQKYIQDGEIKDIVVTTDLSFASPGMTQDVESLLQGSIISDAEWRLIRLNDTLTGPAWSDIMDIDGDGFSTYGVEVLSDDTIMLRLDTTDEKVIPGNYQVRVKCTILGQTHISPPMSLIVQ